MQLKTPSRGLNLDEETYCGSPSFKRRGREMGMEGPDGEKTEDIPRSKTGISHPRLSFSHASPNLYG